MMFLALLALQAPTAQPPELHIFQDWTVGCDNGLYCQAVSLVPEAGEAAQTLSIRRGPRGDAEPVFSFQNLYGADLCGATLSADGRPLPVRIIEGPDCSIVHPADAAALLAALRAAAELRLAGSDGRDLGSVSLAGVSAAMLVMDEAQRRIGTQTALVRPGSRPASAVPAPPPLPVVRLAPLPAGEMPEIGDARIARLRRDNGCAIGDVGGPDEYHSYPLDTGKRLILLACGSGAYNVTWVPFVAEWGRNGRVDISVAPFDSQWAMAEGGRPELINAEWLEGDRLLTEFPRGRGLGDCGTRSTYAWDGTRFRLVRQSTMGECRGAYDYITVWRTRIVQP